MDAGGLRVRLPVICPFLPEVNSPDADTGPETSCFFGSDGKLPPLLRQAYSAVAPALAVTVVVTVSPSPAILKVTVRVPSAFGPVASALTKCGAAANAGEAASINATAATELP